ncbi:MAG: DUF1127 domain-containing protein [Hyphomicrobiales bacterium]|jgi:uncharacterized protein YjiS (DUF1127 family)|nr:DUF1127 domain-containing protein [Hyphomicrobiales bacterium]
MYRFNEAAERELTTPIGPAAAGFGRRAFHEIARFFQAVGNRRAVRRMTLLDDRLLADIGLSRTDVTSALAQPVWVDPSRNLAETVEYRRRGRLWGRPLRRH